MKINFKLPATTQCIVVWFRKGEKHETLMPTPANNDRLRFHMMNQGVGYGELRAVKAVEPNAIVKVMTSLRNSFGRKPVSA